MCIFPVRVHKASPYLLLASLGLAACGPPFERSTIEVVDPRFEDLLPAQARVVRLAGGMQAVEGPVWSDDEEGFLVLSDMDADRLLRWDARAGLTVLREPAGSPNGNARDARGRLVTCEQASGRVVRESDGLLEVLAERYEGRRLNSPNDLALRSDGTIWFTDPSYGLGARPRELAGDYVFRLDPQSGELAVVADDFERPNGICFAPDESVLYVSDSGAPCHVRAFDVSPAGELSHGRVFLSTAPAAPDGVCCDSQGRLYVAAEDGLHVLDADGRPLGRIRPPEAVRNVCFGGPGRRTLFLAAGRSLYSLELVAAGTLGGR